MKKYSYGYALNVNCYDDFPKDFDYTELNDDFMQIESNIIYLIFPDIFDYVDNQGHDSNGDLIGEIQTKNRSLIKIIDDFIDRQETFSTTSGCMRKLIPSKFISTIYINTSCNYVIDITIQFFDKREVK